MHGKSFCALTATLLATGLLLAACSPARNADQDRSKEKSMPAGEREIRYITDRAELLDPARQLYRFGDGICREFARLPGPWRLVDYRRYEKPDRWGRFPAGYDSVPDDPIGYYSATLEAENAALGVPPANTLPGTFGRSGWPQEAVVLSVGPPGWDHWMYSVIESALAGADPAQFQPVQAPFPVSDSFQVYAASSKEYLSELSPLVIINPALRAGVHCYPDYNVPNPSCRGIIRLHEDEGAVIEISYEALGRLQEVVESIIQAARAIRVDCPASGAPS